VSRGGKLFGVDGEILSAELYAQIEARDGLMDDLADIDADIASLTVRAPSAGVVSGLELNPEQIVQEGTPLFTIESNDQIKIDVDIDELDIAGISVGQEAEVEFDALPEKTYTATVVKINPIGVAVNNVTNFTITLQIDSAPEILLGMSADVEIVSQRADNVLVIPQEAIQVIDGEKYVVFEEDVDEELLFTPATHKVVTGITDGVMIEVLSGLGEGDRVAVPQARQLTPQEMQQQMMMGRYGDDEE
jgi:RND family efflux transporter MFP subunit